MAVIAAPPESAAMHILRGMTVDTIPSHLGSLGHRRPVASRASELLVGAVQSKTRLDIMIESPAHPAIRIVATRAVGSQSLLMCVIGFMTRKAGDILV